MEYTSLDSIPFYAECSPLVTGLGFVLVDLKISRHKESVSVSAVIARVQSGSAPIGIDDCAAVHRLLLPRLEVLLGNADIYMEVSSPGLERTIRNAAEFALFADCPVRIWHTVSSDWVQGIIVSSGSDFLELRPMDAEGSEPRRFPLGEIAKAKLLHL